MADFYLELKRQRKQDYVGCGVNETECESENFLRLFLPSANEVWGKVIFLHLSVILFTEGSGPGGVGLVPGGAWYRPPGWLLLWAVRILLECILVRSLFGASTEVVPAPKFKTDII